MIPRTISSLLLALALLSCSPMKSAGRSGNESGTGTGITLDQLRSRIDALLEDSVLAPSFIGLAILSLDDSTLLYSRNAEKLFHPASNMKLFTTATALQTLGPLFQIATKFFVDSAANTGIVRGNLYVRGRGDPLIRVEELDSIARSFYGIGIRSITGSLVGDVTYFDSLSWGKGWMWDDEPSSDEAFISALSVEQNSVTIRVTPAGRTGDPLHVSYTPATSFVNVENFGITSGDTLLPPLVVGRPQRQNSFYVRGHMPPLSDPEEQQLSVCNPELFFLHLLRERLSMNGITVEGGIRIDSTRGTLEVGQITHSMDSLLRQINKPSDNLAAENLLKIMAAERFGPPGIADSGLVIIKTYLHSIGIDTAKMILADGSGVSWYGAVTPTTIISLLKSQYSNKTTFPMFYGSLPVAGRDGTLKRRMVGTRAEGNVRAKTGSLTGVSTLSGYVTTSDGRFLAFSMLANHFHGKLSYLRGVQDKLLELLSEIQLSTP